MGVCIKTHRFLIVNMQYVDTIENNKVTLQTLSSVPVAQGKTREIKERYLNYQMEEE
jgi:DNA-binding LytR/AlgR family response regulator